MTLAQRLPIVLALIALLAAPALAESTLTVSAGGPGRYVYRQGFYLDAQGSSWVPFAFPQPRIAGTDWILENASATLSGIPARGYVIVYVCRRYPGRDGLICGPRDAGQQQGDGRWTIEEYALNGAQAPACAAMAGQLCAATQPANSQQGNGTCAAGQCYACAQGYALQGGQCVQQGGPLPQCLDQAGALCAFAAPSGATQLTGYACPQYEPTQGNTCFQCPAGTNPDRIAGTCVQGNPTSACESNPGMKCVLEPDPQRMHATGKYCDFSGVPGAPYYFSKGCYECAGGFSWSGSACVASGGGTGADADATLCAAAPDATPRDAAHYGTGPAGDQGIAFVSPWKGDSAGTPACCGNQQGEYYLHRLLSGASPDTSVSACCSAQSDCLTSAGQCAPHLALMPSSTTDYCFYNTVYTCSAQKACIARTVAESPYDCYATSSGAGTAYRWGRKDGSDGVRPAEACGDGADNDCNGLTDCADSACAGTQACGGIAQNLRVKRVSVKDAGYGSALSVEICKDAPSAIATAPLTLRVVGQKTYVLDTVVTDNTPLCSAASGWDNWITLDNVFTSVASGQRTVSVSATFSGQDSRADDDAINGATVTIP